MNTETITFDSFLELPVIFELYSKIGSIYKNEIDLNNIDWNKCEQDAVKNLAKEVCEDYAKNNTIFISALARKYNLSRPTIRKYLVNGTKFGWCTYNANESVLKHQKQTSVPIRVFDMAKNLIGIYNSISQCADELSYIYNVNFYKTNIGRAAKSGKPYNNLYFQCTQL